MTRNRSTHLWLAQFAARLLEHYPEMNPLSAVKRAIAMLPELDHLDAITAADQFDTIQKDLMNGGRLIVSPEHIQTVEAFPLSRRIWKVNGHWIAPWMQADWTEVAEQPAFAAIAAQWLVPSANAPGINIGRRDLSPVEQTELRDRARSAWRRPPSAAPASISSSTSQAASSGTRCSARTPTA